MTDEELSKLIGEFLPYPSKDQHYALRSFAQIVAAAEREKVAKWMIQRSYATGHGDTIEDLLAELDWQITENWNRAMINGIETEREACAKVCEKMEVGKSSMRMHQDYLDGVRRGISQCAFAIRERGAP